MHLMKSIIYLNGEGNAEYLPVHHLLAEKTDLRLFFEHFYCMQDLVEGSHLQQELAINYFKDRVADPQCLAIQIRLRIELLLLPFMGFHNRNRLSCIHYFNELLSVQNGNTIRIFDCPIIYLVQVDILRSSSSTILEKMAILDLIFNGI